MRDHKNKHTNVITTVVALSLISGFATLGLLSDIFTTFRVKKKLYQSLGLRCLNIRVSCNEGFIKISGYVKNRKVLNKIIRIILHTPGVLDINSNKLKAL